MVTVLLFGAGPGLYVDLTVFSFQVPTLLSAAQAAPARTSVSIRNFVATAVSDRICTVCLLTSVRDPNLLTAGLGGRFSSERAEKMWKQAQSVRQVSRRTALSASILSTGCLPKLSLF
jgi:hypothetical protein